MAREVRKYELFYGPAATEMPVGAQILRVGIQNGRVRAWALVNPAAEMTSRRIGYFATGAPIPDNAEHIGTAVTSDAEFVWHVFEEVAF
jgi:hypothetical protein